MGLRQANRAGPTRYTGVATARACPAVLPICIPVASNYAAVEGVLHGTIQNVLDQVLAVIGYGASACCPSHVLRQPRA